MKTKANGPTYYGFIFGSKWCFCDGKRLMATGTIFFGINNFSHSLLDNDYKKADDDLNFL